jgi:MtN3 and saliva related transmembrane protein
MVETIIFAGDEMEAVTYVGTVAAVCATGSYIPQIIKIRKQGGEDLSFPMLFLYLTGTLLWLAYGLMLNAPAVIWANAITSLLVITAIVLKMNYSRPKSLPSIPIKGSGMSPEGESVSSLPPQTE